MKILFLTDKMDIGGAETHISTLTRALLRRGHCIVLASSGGSLSKKLSEEHSIPHLRLPLSSRSPRDLILCYRRLLSLIRKEGFDLIHSHARIPSLIASLISKKTGIPLVCTAHAKFSATYLKKSLTRWGEHPIAVSEDLKQYLIENYRLAPENITVIPNGIDTERFSPAYRPSAPIKIGFLSRLDGDCSLGARLLCAIAPRICSEFGKVEILIGGGGSAHAEVALLAKRANDSIGYECVRLIGKVEDTPSFFSSCHIFVGVSRAAIEAAASGAKVIICGDEGYFGALTPARFEDALSSNFCARGYPKANQKALLGDILSHSNIDSSGVLLLVQSELNSQKMADQTEKVYLRALTRQNEKDRTVLLCGYYGYGNMGDDALLRSAIRRARSTFPHLSVVALTRRGKSDSATFGTRCIRRYSPLSLFTQLRRCEYFTLGGGTLLQSSTSLRSLLYYSLLIRLAKLFGAKCLLWANGLGEISSALSGAIVKGALKKCDRIGLRDASSVKIARSLVPHKRIFFENDLATYISCADDRRCRYLLSRAFGESDIFTDFIIAAPKRGVGLVTLEGALWEAKAKGLRICFVAMHAHQDKPTVLQLSRKFGEPVISGICYADLLALVKYSKGVYSMRLHALIAAKSAGVVYKAFGNDEKLKTI